ncbi:MAG: S8 family peptidase, partial [Rhodococcus sp. (in: high G+C Gram-positive bacteria)]
MAILDTGCGEHDWLGFVTKGVDQNPVIGIADPSTDPEVYPDLLGPLDGQMDPVAGHGTFITGLVHQEAPDADILTARVLFRDGIVYEADVLDALARLLAFVRADKANRIDVLNLSLGFYHEENVGFTSAIRNVLTALRRTGVVVVASAGNDATNRPCYPAAFSLDPPDASAAPLISVGANNPNGTEALFSNSGDWVTLSVCGAAVISTMPEFDAGANPLSRRPAAGSPRDRETIDPDDFLGGFGVWSGTSFAAPIVAGRIAAALTAS